MTPALADLEQASEEPTKVVEALADLGRLEYENARFGEAERYLERAIRLDKTHLLSEQDTLSLLGRIAFARGDLLSSEAPFRKALDRSRRTYGPDAPATAQTENDLACVLHAGGRFREAKSLYEHSLSVRQKIDREDHPAILQSLHNLGRLAEDEGDLAQAERRYRASLDLKALPGVYDPRGALLMYSVGSLLTTRREFNEAGLRLAKSIGVRRRILPDNHPDIARSLAGLARLAHLEGRYGDAEPYYRDCLARLDRELGPDHPDRITLANNLASLLAERGQSEEAITLWRDSLARTLNRPMRPVIEATLKRNLARAGEERAGERPGGSYETIGIFALDMGDIGEAEDGKSQGGVARVVPPSRVVRFRDDFAGSTIDSSKWEYGGHAVFQVPGELRVDRTITDAGGWLRTRPILIDPALPLLVRREAKVHAANHWFGGSMEIEITGYPEHRFGVGYSNFEERPYFPVLGFSIFRRDSNPNNEERRVNASSLIPPVWSRWFEEELLYDPRSGEVRYSIDGATRIVYNVGRMPPTATSITLLFTTWGWYTGHYQHVRHLAVEQ